MLLSKAILLHSIHIIDSEETELEVKIAIIEVLAMFTNGLKEATYKLTAIKSQKTCYCGDHKTSSVI